MMNLKIAVLGLTLAFFSNAQAADIKDCKTSTYIGKSIKNGFAWEAPLSNVDKKTEFECITAGNDSLYARLTLFQDQTGEVAFVVIGDKASYVCPLKWKRDDGKYSFDIKPKSTLKNLLGGNKELIKKDSFSFTKDSMIQLSGVVCDQSVKK